MGRDGPRACTIRSQATQLRKDRLEILWRDRLAKYERTKNLVKPARSPQHHRRTHIRKSLFVSERYI